MPIERWRILTQSAYRAIHPQALKTLLAHTQSVMGPRSVHLFSRCLILTEDLI